jgi:hypothetical protein
VHSTCLFLLNRDASDTIEIDVANALKCLWLNDVPSKVSIFGWRLFLLAKLPTRKALSSKRIIVNIYEFCCAFCFWKVEDTYHLFFKREFSKQVWKSIFKWLNVDYIPFEEGCAYIDAFEALVKSKKRAKVRHLIWPANIWRLSNNKIFRGEISNLSILVDHIIFISWFRLIGRIFFFLLDFAPVRGLRSRRMLVCYD